MSTLVHGIELNREMKPAWFRFGILRLLHHLADVKVDETSAPDWARRFRRPAFVLQVQHFQQSFWKFDRAAWHVARCKSAFHWWAESGQREPLHISDPKYLAFSDAHRDLPLHLDLMFFYLHIQADAYAKFVPYFYEPRTEGKMSTQSFHDQLKWFVTTKPGFDAAYASVLRANHSWFDRLAGEDPKGLRHVLVHHSPAYQFGWNQRDTNGPPEFRFRAGLYTSAKYVEEDLFEALREITRGWFAFLDAAWHHFALRLANVGVLLTMSVDEVEKTRYHQCTEGELPSFWVYPSCA